MGGIAGTGLFGKALSATIDGFKPGAQLGRQLRKRIGSHVMFARHGPDRKQPFLRGLQRVGLEGHAFQHRRHRGLRIAQGFYGAAHRVQRAIELPVKCGGRPIQPARRL